jgi:iron complex outermembrane receptor protein
MPKQSKVVTDENGQALPYSNVVDKATANGVTTDGNGNFEIRVGITCYVNR